MCRTTFVFDDINGISYIWNFRNKNYSELVSVNDLDFHSSFIVSYRCDNIIPIIWDSYCFVLDKMRNQLGDNIITDSVILSSHYDDELGAIFIHIGDDMIDIPVGVRHNINEVMFLEGCYPKIFQKDIDKVSSEVISWLKESYKIGEVK